MQSEHSGSTGDASRPPDGQLSSHWHFRGSFFPSENGMTNLPYCCGSLHCSRDVLIFAVLLHYHALSVFPPFYGQVPLDSEWPM